MGVGPPSWTRGGCGGTLAGRGWEGVHRGHSGHSRGSRPQPVGHQAPTPALLSAPLDTHSPCLRLQKGMVLWPMKSFLEEAS